MVMTAMSAFAMSLSGQPYLVALKEDVAQPEVLISDYRWPSRTGSGACLSYGAIVLPSIPYSVTPELDTVLQKAVNVGLEHKYFL